MTPCIPLKARRCRSKRLLHAGDVFFLYKKIPLLKACVLRAERIVFGTYGSDGKRSSQSFLDTTRLWQSIAYSFSERVSI